jgi:hypothetical protein
VKKLMIEEDDDVIGIRKNGIISGYALRKD